jgi:glycerate dehydrogenase
MVKYLNNITEQDHKFLKRKIKPMLGFESLKTVEKTIVGIEAMDMNILAYDKITDGDPLMGNCRWASMDEVLCQSDVITLHCPLFPDNIGMINKVSLKKMKRTAFLINTSRGRLVVNEDLAEALNEGLIAGAGLDVLSVEPPDMGNPLFRAKNVFITPHIAWATREARSRLMNTAVANLKAFLEGSPVNVVNRTTYLLGYKLRQEEYHGGFK